ncbi:MAG: tRNA (adenosine(37)-N6)-dimethylallyltransferase MiaA [Bdellovibrionales bacterium]|nr:tRNA (adenosine(37)-N6)-dimethylallyltransferase MiaA [Bdellovibrionales bacterium]
MKIPIITGTTASGKTALALELAAQMKSVGARVEIINADSLLVYRGLDIGTAKPSSDELKRLKHHLIDTHFPNETYTAGDFARDVNQILESDDGQTCFLIVGGTGFYLKALLFGIWDGPKADPEVRARLEKETNESLHQKLTLKDPISAAKIAQADRYRLVRALEIIEISGKLPSELEAQSNKSPDPRFDLIILDRPNPELFERIEKRTKQMLEQGLVDETKRALDRYGDCAPLGSVGYAQVVDHIRGIAPQGRKSTTLSEEISLATRQLVKRQRTWFKGQFPFAQPYVLDQDREKVWNHVLAASSSFQTEPEKPQPK